MQGKIINYEPALGTGIIRGNDGVRYEFMNKDWETKDLAPINGIAVDFEANDGHAKKIFKMETADIASGKKKSRLAAILLAFFLGGFGIHKFYLGQIGWGIVYLVFFWTGIPALISIIEFIMLILMSDEKFDRRFN